MCTDDYNISMVRGGAKLISPISHFNAPTNYEYRAECGQTERIITVGDLTNPTVPVGWRDSVKIRSDYLSTEHLQIASRVFN